MRLLGVGGSFGSWYWFGAGGTNLGSTNRFDLGMEKAPAAEPWPLGSYLVGAGAHPGNDSGGIASALHDITLQR